TLNMVASRKPMPFRTSFLPATDTVSGMVTPALRPASAGATLAGSRARARNVGASHLAKCMEVSLCANDGARCGGLDGAVGESILYQPPGPVHARAARGTRGPRSFSGATARRPGRAGRAG